MSVCTRIDNEQRAQSSTAASLPSCLTSRYFTATILHRLVAIVNARTGNVSSDGRDLATVDAATKRTLNTVFFLVPDSVVGNAINLKQSQAVNISAPHDLQRESLSKHSNSVWDIVITRM
jgi:hypothetical protein